MMKRKWILLAIVAALLVVGSVFCLNYYRRVAIGSFDDCVGAGFPASKTYPLQCEAYGKVFVKQGSDPVEVAVDNVVTNFGRVMQFVSTNAPKKIAAQAVADNYRDLVSPSLLAAWMQNPAKAPGRQVSSPWPDHVVVTSVTRVNTTTYTVAGDVIELTSDNVADGGMADEYTATATVAVEDGNWVITNWDSSRK